MYSSPTPPRPRFLDARHADPAPPMSAGGPGRSAATRVLHLLLLLMVVHQLLGSEFIEMPFPGDPPSLLFVLHEYAGLAGGVVIGAFWLWTLARRGETRPGRLFPWLSPRRIGDVIRDGMAQLRRLLRLQAPDDGDGALASAVHGLGLLAATAMAATGTAYFLAPWLLGPGAAIGGIGVARGFLFLHKALANLMWAYLIGHAAVAALHHLLGSDILSRMFWRRRQRA